MQRGDTLRAHLAALTDRDHAEPPGLGLRLQVRGEQPVPLLEDVQGQAHAREQHRRQREQGQQLAHIEKSTSRGHPRLARTDRYFRCPAGAEPYALALTRPPARRWSTSEIRFTKNSKFRILKNGRLRLPKVGDVSVRWSRDLPAPPSSVTVVLDASGRFFASFAVEIDSEPLPETTRVCGIDLGLRHFAVLDDGTKVCAPQFLRRAEKKLKHAQRELSRKGEGSKNREKARIRTARLHAKVTDARRDFHHKLSTAIIRENQVVTVEDLAVNGLARTKLAKSVYDAGWSSFTTMLEYKARLHGREFRRIGRFEPTSQLCSACGAKDGPKPLHIRVWTCARCGTTHDRDVNAARNIAALGRREARNARGGNIRPGLVLADADEAGSRRGAT